MNEPSEQAREVLARYRDALGPSSAERAALVLGVQRAIATGAGPSAIATAAAVGRRTPWLVIVGVTAVVAGGAWWSMRSPGAHAPVISAVSAPNPAMPEQGAVPEQGAEPAVTPSSVAPATLPSTDAIAIAPQLVPAPPTVLERSGGRRARRPSATSVGAITPTNDVTPTTEPLTVDAEVALLREASIALKRGDDATARDRYDEHARRFPSGALVELREVGLTLLDCRADPSAADERARRFAARFPGSPHLVRIERECTP